MHKVCFVTTISLTLKTFVLELAKTMHQTGNFEIHFICDHDSDFEKLLPEYIHYKPIAMKRGISFDGLKAIGEMYRYFKKEKFDLVQYSTPNASCYAAIASALAGIPSRLYCQWGIAYVGFCGIKRIIFKQIERLVCRCSTKIEPDSFGNLHFSHEEKLYGAEKSCVIWNGSASGVNIQKFDISRKNLWKRETRTACGIPEDAVVFTFIGRITKEKGINELFAASKKLIEVYEDVYLLLVGPVEKSDSVDADLYQWSQEEQRVIYIGYTNQVERYLAASDIYVLPSYREGFGSAIVEAEAMGVPVIVTDIPGPTEAMMKNSTGLVVKKCDAAELHSAMEKLYLSEELRAEMGRSGLEFVSNRFEQKTLFEKIYNDRLDLIQNRRCKNGRK